MESQHLRVIRVWAALAWADGVIAKSEAAAMKRLVEGANELSDDEKKTALGFLENKVELDTAGLEGLGWDAKEGIYRAALRLAGIDQHVDATELALLEKLRGALGISEKRAKEIQDSTPAPKKK
jgi:tellurite resistance protein